MNATERATAADIDLRVALANAVAANPKAHAKLINFGNHWDGTAPIRVAVERGGAFAVEVAGGLLPIDHDNQAAAYGEIVSALDEARIEYVELASGGEAHRRHLWVALGDVTPAVRAAIEAGCRARSVDVRTGGALMRPPFTPHRTGTTMTLLTPASPFEAVRILAGPGAGEAAARRLADLIGAAPAPAAPTPVRTGGKRKTMTPETAALLETGRIEGGEGTRSAVERSLLLGLANVEGIDEEAAVKMLLGSPCGAKANAEADPDAHARRQWAKAVSHVDAAPAQPGRNEIRMEAARLEAVVADRAWPTVRGSGAENVNRVLRGVLVEMQRVGTWELDLATRTVADRAGVHESTAAKVMRSMVKEGVMRRVGGRAAMPNAQRWAIDRAHPAFGGGPTVERLADMAADVWRHGGGGAKAMGTWQRLRADEPRHPAAMVTDHGPGKRAIQGHLAKLKELGLAHRTEDGWLRIPEHAESEAFTRAAVIAGTAGRGAAVAKRRAEDAVAWKTKLEEWADDAADARAGHIAYRLARRERADRQEAEEMQAGWAAWRDELRAEHLDFGTGEVPAPERDTEPVWPPHVAESLDVAACRRQDHMWSTP